MASSIIELYVRMCRRDQPGNIFGQFDEHLKLIERTLNVTLIARDDSLKILGNQTSASQAKKRSKIWLPWRAEETMITAECQLRPVPCHGRSIGRSVME